MDALFRFLTLAGIKDGGSAICGAACSIIKT